MLEPLALSVVPFTSPFQCNRFCLLWFDKKLNGVYSLKWRLTDKYLRWGTLAGPRPGRADADQCKSSDFLQEMRISGFPALLSVPHLLSREIKMNRRHLMKRGAFFQRFWVSTVITTAHAHKICVIFHIFHRAFNKKKIKDLQPKTTKIASTGLALTGVLFLYLNGNLCRQVRKWNFTGCFSEPVSHSSNALNSASYEAMVNCRLWLATQPRNFQRLAQVFVHGLCWCSQQIVNVLLCLCSMHSHGYPAPCPNRFSLEFHSRRSRPSVSKVISQPRSLGGRRPVDRATGAALRLIDLTHVRAEIENLPMYRTLHWSHHWRWLASPIFFFS